MGSVPECRVRSEARSEAPSGMMAQRSNGWVGRSIGDLSLTTQRKVTRHVPQGERNPFEGSGLAPYAATPPPLPRSNALRLLHTPPATPPHRKAGSGADRKPPCRRQQIKNPPRPGRVINPLVGASPDVPPLSGSGRRAPGPRPVSRRKTRWHPRF